MAKLELASELEPDLRDTVDWGKKWLVDFNAGKTQLVSFDWSNNNGSIDVKIDRFVLEEKSSFKMLWLTLLVHAAKKIRPHYLFNQGGQFSIIHTMMFVIIKVSIK